MSELRDRARQRGRPFREIVEETIQRGLSATPSSCGKPVTVQTHRVGIKPAYQGLSLNQLYDQIEAEDNRKRFFRIIRIPAGSLGTGSGSAAAVYHSVSGRTG
jgi:hypothetical protein